MYSDDMAEIKRVFDLFKSTKNKYANKKEESKKKSLKQK